MDITHDYNQFIQLSQNGETELSTEYFLNMVRKYGTLQVLDYNLKQLQKLKSKSYYYLITFTVDTKKNTTSYPDIYKYIIKQFQKSHIDKAYIVQEGDSKKHIHWHVAVKSSRYIKKSYFKYYINKHGNIDISKNRVKNMETMLQYISKSNNPYQIPLRE